MVIQVSELCPGKVSVGDVSPWDVMGCLQVR